MNEKYLYKEDARKWRIPMLIISIFAFCGFIAFLTIAILWKTHIIVNLLDGDKYTTLAKGAFLVGLFCIASLFGKYLKYFMFITEQKMKFFAENKMHNYEISEFKSYEIIKARRRYTDFKLFFSDGNSYIVSSFKSINFKDVLDSILKTNK